MLVSEGVFDESVGVFARALDLKLVDGLIEFKDQILDSIKIVDQLSRLDLLAETSNLFLELLHAGALGALASFAFLLRLPMTVLTTASCAKTAEGPLNRPTAIASYHGIPPAIEARIPPTPPNATAITSRHLPGIFLVSAPSCGSRNKFMSNMITPPTIVIHEPVRVASIKFDTDSATSFGELGVAGSTTASVSVAVALSIGSG